MAEKTHPTLSHLLSETDPASRDRAWTALVAEHSRLLMHVTRSFGGGYDAALDRYEYILEHLRRDDFRRLRAFAADGRGRFSTWLVVVARRLCVDHHRHVYGRAPTTTGDAHSAALQQRAERRLLVQLAAGPHGEEDDASDDAPSPDLALREAELGRALQGALESLGAEDRLILRLRVEDGVTAREVAEIVGLPSAFHVYRRVNAICAHLRALLRRQGVEDPVP